MDRTTLETLVGVTGTTLDDVFKISVLRKDVHVTVDGFAIIPFMGLTSWVIGLETLLR